VSPAGHPGPHTPRAAGPTNDQGRTFNPVLQERARRMRFRAARTVNKLGRILPGRGECWGGEEKHHVQPGTLRCEVGPGGDIPTTRSSGFGRTQNPANPFKNGTPSSSPTCSWTSTS